ncbi:DUF192 domain-containing protein [Patescibacteria group bacterium]|nr:DUF192 domain-containing protein [Patescibacteria group bacterium]
MSKNYFYEIIFSRIALIIFVIAMFLIVGVIKQPPATVAVPTVEDTSTKLILPNGLTIKTEVVDTPELKSEGLSGRDSLGEQESMLFVFESEGYHDFWMLDMHFAIDMIWMDEEYKIVDITKDARPMPDLAIEELPRYRSVVPAQYILEVNSGFSARYNLQVGDKLKLT